MVVSGVGTNTFSYQKQECAYIPIYEYALSSEGILMSRYTGRHIL